jgi:DnaB helicase-like protein/AAA domain-containing protein
VHRDAATAGAGRQRPKRWDGGEAALTGHIADAERSVLAAMLLGSEAISRARGLVGAQDFFRAAHQKVFAALCALDDHGQAADSITLTDELARRGELELVGGPAAIACILEAAVTAANLGEHAAIVVEASRKRHLRRLLIALQVDVEDPTLDSAGIVSRLSATGFGIPAGTPYGVGSGRNESRLFLTARELAAEVPAEVPWLVRPWVARGAVTEFVGKVKGGKSTLLGAMVKALVTGGTFLGEPVPKTRVVWLTEQSPITFRALLARVGLDKTEDLLVQPWHTVMDREWEAVAVAAVHKANECGAGLLIVDTLGQFARLRGEGAENNAAEALAAMRPLQAAAAGGLGVAVVRHERKSGGEVGDSGRGSSAYAGAVDVVVAVRRPEGASRPTLRALHAVSRFDDTPPELVVEWTGRTYAALGDSRDVALQDAKAGLFREVPAGEGHALALDDLLGRLPNTKRTVAQEAVKVLMTNGALRSVGAGRRGDPRRYYRPMDSAGAPAGSGGMSPTAEGGE